MLVDQFTTKYNGRCSNYCEQLEPHPVSGMSPVCSPQQQQAWCGRVGLD